MSDDLTRGGDATKLWRVSLVREWDTMVLACSEEEAEEIAASAPHGDERPECTAELVTEASQIPRDWKLSLPHAEAGCQDDRTCLQWFEWLAGAKEREAAALGLRLPDPATADLFTGGAS